MFPNTLRFMQLTSYLNGYSNSYKIGYVLRGDLARSVKNEWEQVGPRLKKEMARGDVTPPFAPFGGDFRGVVGTFQHKMDKKTRK